MRILNKYSWMWVTLPVCIAINLFICIVVIGPSMTPANALGKLLIGGAFGFIAAVVALHLESLPPKPDKK